MKKEARSVLVAYSDTGSFFAKTIDCRGQRMAGDVGLPGNNANHGRYFSGFVRSFGARVVEIPCWHGLGRADARANVQANGYDCLMRD